MPDTITTSNETAVQVPAHQVYLRARWNDAWELEPYLYCDSAAVRATPEKSSAILHYDYGNILRPDQSQVQTYAPLEIDHWYAKVVIDWYDAEGEYLPIAWYGIVFDRDDDAYGAPIAGSGSGPRIATGTQKFTAYGMEELLARETVRASTIENPLAGQPGIDPPPPDEVDVGRPLAFNFTSQHAADQVVPNRSVAKGAKGAYIFAQRLGTAQPWDTYDCVEYLLAYRSPRDDIGGVTIPFRIDGLTAGAIPDYDRPRLEIKTDTVKELLDKLLSRKRLVSYWVTVEEAEGDGADVVVLKAFTFLQANMAVPTSYPDATGGFTTGTAAIDANPVLVQLDYDEAFDVEFASLRRAGHDKYDQVIVRGSRKTSTFTTSFADANLQPDWPAALESEYQTGASAQPGYQSTSAEMQFRNALWRSADKYKRVYRWFALPVPWIGEADDGENSGNLNPVFPLDDEFAEGDAFYRPALLFSHQLALLTDHDYTGDNILLGTVADSTPAGGRAERLRPMALLKIVSDVPPVGSGSGQPSGDGSGNTGDRYQFVEKLAEVAKTDKFALGGASFTCSLRVQDRNLGIELNVHGAPQHAIAGSEWVPADYSDLQNAPLDYHDNLLLTATCEADSFCEALQPVAPTPEDEIDAEGDEEPNADLVRTLLIDLSHLEHGQALRLDYVVPNTVVALADGQLQRSSGGYVRDDRGRLEALAQVAWQWYKVERQAFTLKYRQVDGQFELGDLITQVGSGATFENVNTPITSIEWDLLSGSTTITTGFAELDFGNFL